MNLNQFVNDEIKSVLGQYDLSGVAVSVPKDRSHGDFATNAAMVLSKPLGKSPREIAESILPNIAALPFIASADIAGPGFINIKLKDSFITKSITNYQLPITNDPQTICLDYGSYNVAKSLHIGHARTSIVGDSFNRIAKFLGHKTIAYNHIGDWGRPMGLVIAYLEALHPNWPFWSADFDPSKINPTDYKITAEDLDTLYPLASARAKDDSDFLAHAQQITKEFQDGHPGYTAIYNIFLKTSLDMMDDIIARLNMMPFDKTLGERNAAENVASVEKLLLEKNLLIKDDGAEIVIVKRDTDTAPMPPLMFNNSRGADTYGATDLAALYYRKKTDNPDKVLYFTDLRQGLHFTQVFRTAEMIGLFDENQMEHIGYGTLNGKDGKPFKTRDGNVAGLLDIMILTNLAVDERIKESGKILDFETLRDIALAALKFNDLSHELKSDYVFDVDTLTSFEGKTGPYILYTAVRLNKIIERAPRGEQRAEIKETLEKDERNLLLCILDFNRVVQMAFEKRSPDILANYTYELCQMSNTFYHNCPVLRDDVPADIRAHRIAIVEKTVTTLTTAIDLMGLKIPNEM